MGQIAKSVDFWDEVRDRLKFTPAPSTVAAQGAALAERLGVSSHALAGLPVPHRRLERWKHTPVAAILRGSWKQQPLAAPSVEVQPVPGLEAYRLVLINGHFSAEHSDLPVAEGVLCMPLSQAPPQAWSSTTHREDWFAALHAASVQDGLFLQVAPGVVLDRPVLVHHITEGTDVAAFPRNVVVVGANAQVRLIGWHSGSAQATGLVVSRWEVSIGADAHCEWDQIESVSGAVHHLHFPHVIQAENSHFRIHSVSPQSHWSRHDLRIRIEGEHAETILHGCSLPQGVEFMDHHTTVDHRVANCRSEEDYRSVLYDRATGVFNGKVFVLPDAQKTDAYQKSANMLASDQATLHAKPELEIYADDVKCSHGCTVGQLDEEALFYAQSRGISARDAHALLIEAFIADVVNGIGVEEVKAEVQHAFAVRRGWWNGEGA
jgi:Fe-S cluster assembly protein SufD